MPPLYIGSQKVDACYMGSDKIDKGMLGSDKVCEKKDPPGEKIYDRAGTYTFTVPKGYTTVQLCMIGGGGSSGNVGDRADPGGGYAGSIFEGDFTVVSEARINVTIGRGGAATHSDNTMGNSGTASSFGSKRCSGGNGGRSAGYQGDGSSKHNCMGTFRDGTKVGDPKHHNKPLWGGEAGFANGGSASARCRGGSVDKGAGGGACNEGTSSGCAAGGDGYIKISWS